MEKGEWVPLKEYLYKIKGKTVKSTRIILKYGDLEFTAPDIKALLEFLPTMIVLAGINQHNLLSGGAILARHVEIGRVRNDNIDE